MKKGTFAGKPFWIALIVIAALIAIDQFIKVWALDNLKNAVEPVQFIKFGSREIINLTYYENTGAAFSILEGKLPFLIIVTSLFLLVGIYLLATKRVHQPFLIGSASLIIAGGMGNLIDRIFRGFVVDYVEVRLFRFAVFNFADCCVVIGAILMLFYTLFLDNKKEPKEEDSANAPS